MTSPPAYTRIRVEDLEYLDHRVFDVIGAIPRSEADPRDGIYVVVRERPPYARRLMVEVEDPDDPATLARLKQIVGL